MEVAPQHDQMLQSGWTGLEPTKLESSMMICECDRFSKRCYSRLCGGVSDVHPDSLFDV